MTMEYLQLKQRCWAGSFSRSEVVSYLYLPSSFQRFLSLFSSRLPIGKGKCSFYQIGRIKRLIPGIIKTSRMSSGVHAHRSPDDGEGVSPYYGMGANWMFACSLGR